MPDGRTDYAELVRRWRGVEQLHKMDRVETKEAAALGHIGQQIVRRAVADGAGRSGRLVDVLVVEDGLRSPSGLLVEIMLPANAPEVAPIVASKAASSPSGGSWRLRNRWRED